MRFLLLLVLTAQAMNVQTASQKLERLPLQKKEISFESPTHYAKRLLRVDLKTGKEVYYDHKPRIVPLDANSGKYALKWIGRDGKSKTVTYQRPDAIDAIVSASASRPDSGKYLYLYNIKSLPLSTEQLSGFTVQNYASDVSPARMKDILVGVMTNSSSEFKEGNWIAFGILSTFKPLVARGRSIEFRLDSPAPPGLVECRVRGGYQGMTVAGEEPPTDLLNLLPAHEAWPKGYTIGPVENLRTLSPVERASNVHKLLPQLHRLGWMTADALRWYQQNLRGDNLSDVYRHVSGDLKKGDITTEVFALIDSIRQ